jgi:hypothetical protein
MKYRIEQLPNSIKVEGGIIDPTVVIQSSADARAAWDRRGKIVDPCLNTKRCIYPLPDVDIRGL